MGNYENLKQSITEVIRTNGNQEITGAVLQSTLLTIISTVGANATFAGIATPTTNPGTPDGPVFYLASESGTYTNFNAIELQDGLSVLMWNSSWNSQQIFSIDDEPTAGSDNLVRSGGVERYVEHIIPVEDYSFSDDDSVIFKNNEDKEVFRIGSEGPITEKLFIQGNNGISSFNKEYFDKSKEATKYYRTSETPITQVLEPKDEFRVTTEDGVTKLLINNRGVFLDGNEDVQVLPDNYGGDKEFYNKCSFYYTKYNRRFLRINNTYNIFYNANYGELIKNPLININFPDASWTKGGDGYFYICATDFPMYIYKSKDFVNWVKCGQVFANDDPWNTNDWAPSINYINNKYYVYSISNFEVQLRVSNTPEGPYTLVKESMIVGGAVDPQYVDGGYLVYNNNSGVVLQKLNNDLDTLIGEPIVLVPPTDRNEGSYIYHYGNYYYLFASAPYSNTVDYNIKIYRSSVLEAANWEYGGVLMGSENGDFLYGPGHVGEILKTEDNHMFIPMQICIKGLSPEYDSGDAAYRPTILQELKFNSNSEWFEFIDINDNVITKPSLLVRKPNV